MTSTLYAYARRDIDMPERRDGSSETGKEDKMAHEDGEPGPPSQLAPKGASRKGRQVM